MRVFRIAAGIPVAAPFPHIAGHVAKTELIGVISAYWRTEYKTINV